MLLLVLVVVLWLLLLLLLLLLIRFLIFNGDMVVVYQRVQLYYV